MLSITQLLTIARWSGYLTLFCAVLVLLGWVLKWGIRFRLVGITGFMGVLTGGLFALGLGLHDRPNIPGAVQFSRVFDTGTAQIVIAVAPQITANQLEATLRQAAADLYSPGRLTQGADEMTILARTVIHPEPGLSQPLYLGQVKRALSSRVDDQVTIEIYPDQLAQLPQPAA